MCKNTIVCRAHKIKEKEKVCKKKNKSFLQKNALFRNILDITPLTKDEIKGKFRKGWHDLIDEAYEMVSFVPDVKIINAKRREGLLHCYVDGTGERNLNAAEGICWKVQRLSATVCEGCGKIGKRRKELKYVINFCVDCYFEYLNSVDDPMTLFKEGQEGRF